MRLVRFGPSGAERPAVVGADGELRDVSALVGDWAGAALGRAALAELRRADIGGCPVVPGSVRLGPPVAAVGKFICVGLNYADHARETNASIPDAPIIFMKATTAICGPFDDVLVPPGAEKVDWEVELGVVIGEVTRNVSVADALDHVAGYLVVHDVSERAFQLEHGGQWVKGKSYDSFGPIGPYLVTRDEVPDVQALGLRLAVNGVVQQNGNTSDMIFDVATLVSHISRYMTLMPGDIITTGTPAGVALGSKTARYLRAGDVVELSIDGLGAQRQSIVADRR